MIKNIYIFANIGESAKIQKYHQFSQDKNFIVSYIIGKDDKDTKTYSYHIFIIFFIK
jgi:hypothetical protein